MKYYSLEKAKSRWEANYTWQPLLAAFAIILFVAVLHKSHWELNTETNPLRVWEQRERT